MNHRDKIKEPQELFEILESLKNQGKKIVHCHGCFDILHPGHLRYLEFAKNQGDVLVVSLSGDKYIGKGIKTPFATSQLRAESMASVVFVDYVTIDNNPDACNLINLIKPQVYIKGKEYAFEKKEHPGFLKEKNTIESHGGKVIYSPGDIVFSSTKIIKESFEREDMLVERCRSYLMKHKINIEDMRKTLDNFKNSKVIVIGDLFFKDYLFCNNPAISKDSINLDLEIMDEQRIIGGAGLIAKYLSDLDSKVTLISSYSRDDSNDLIDEIKSETNIEAILFEFDKFKNPVKKRIISKEHTILDLKIGNKFILDEETESRIIKSILEKMHSCTGIILCDYGFGFLTPKLIDSITNIAKQYNIPLTLINGANTGRNIEKYPDLNFIIMNENEARHFTDDFYSGFDFLSKQVFSKANFNNLIMDLDNEGFICYRPAIEPDETAGNYATYLPLFSSKHKYFSEWKEALKAIISLARFSGADIYVSLYLGNLVSLVEIPVLNKGSISATDLLSVLETRKELF